VTQQISELDTRVRLEIFRVFLEQQRAPGVTEVAARTDMTAEEAVKAFERLAESRAIVLRPGTHELWMANPFSAIPTPFTVATNESEWYGNCIWDSFGILGLLRKDGTIRSKGPDCEEPMTVQVEDGRVVGGEGLVHFAVPAAHWWDDIGYT
jgi:hypothetical protein